MFIANCVGERNRKVFVLFLIFTFISIVEIIVLSITHFIITFRFHSYALFYNEYLIISFAILLILLLLGILGLIIKKEKATRLSATIISLTITACCIMFYILVGLNNSYVYNPFGLLLIILCLSASPLINENLCNQLKYLSIGLTTKQYSSLEKATHFKVTKPYTESLISDSSSINENNQTITITENLNINYFDNENSLIELNPSFSKRVKNIVSFVFCYKPHKSILTDNYIIPFLKPIKNINS